MSQRGDEEQREGEAAGEQDKWFKEEGEGEETDLGLMRGGGGRDRRLKGKM